MAGEGGGERPLITWLDPFFGFIPPNWWVAVCPQGRVRAEIQRGEAVLVWCGRGLQGQSGALPR